MAVMFFLSFPDQDLQKHLRQRESNNHQEEQSQGRSHDAMPPEAMDQLLEMTMNPQLQRRTTEKFIEVREKIKNGKVRIDKKADIAAWEERGPNNVSGRTRAVLFDKNDPSGNKVWSGSVSGGLWQTDNFHDEEVQWTPVNDFFQNIAISSLAQDPINSDVIYFGTGEGWFNGDAVRGLGIWKTSDGGQSWDQLPSTNNSTFSYIQKILIDEVGNLYACTRLDGLQKSQDGGQSWSKILGGGIGGAFSNRAADIEMASNGDIYVSLGIKSTDGIYKSTDGGSSWVSLSNLAPNNGLPSEGYERIELATAPSNDQIVYALYESDEDNTCLGIFRTVDGGNSWTALPVPSTSTSDNFTNNQAWYNLIAQVDPNNAQIVYIGGIDLLRSLDGGMNWTPISHWYGDEGLQEVHADQHNIVFYPGSSHDAIVSNDGGIYSMNIDPDAEIESPYCPVDHFLFFPDFITNVTLGSINNSSGRGISTNVEGYSDYSDLSTTLEAGQSYTLSFTTNLSFDDSKASAWIDWNGNYEFEEEERILFSSGDGPYQESFVVPQNAAHQTTRLRVRMQFGPDYVPDPCRHSGFASGETEDYSVVVNNCIEGNQCNDGDPCTINDMLDASCNCIGELFDSDNNGTCDYLPTPTISSKKHNYNVTQFYSCAIHPDAGSNIILGGTQDNGTQLFANAGMNSTREVTGGDGGFCFIDQDEPNIQISTYVYNNIRITSDLWNDHERFSIGESTGRFINPMDYDSRSNILFSAHEDGFFARVREVGTNNLQDSFYLEALDDLQISAVRVDPNVENRVWFLTPKTLSGDSQFNAKIIGLDHSDQDQPTIYKEIDFNDNFFFGSAYARALDIASGNSDRMLLLFSNSGVPNIWLTEDGGNSWENLDGNLPDIPIFWIMFDPLNPNGIIVTSEMGIWSTDQIDGGNTQWSVMNEGLANVRVDMIKYRPSDQTLVAATHGRGMFTTTLLSSQDCDISFEVDIESISDQEVRANPSGGTPPYSYSWTDADQQTTQSAVDLTPGTYTVSVYDANGCIAFNHITLGEGEAQTENIISSAGSSFSSQDIKIDWTIGEILVDQKMDASIDIGEGFHQLFIGEEPEGPDFEILDMSLVSNVFFSGETRFNAGQMVIRNNGTESTPSDFATILLSPDESWDISDVVVAFASFDILEPQETDTIGFTTIIDNGISAGDYFLISCLDEFDFIEEINENNNCTDLGITIAEDSERPDLIISDIEISQLEYMPGNLVSMTVSFQNIGNTPSFTSFLEHQLYLSVDSSATQGEEVQSFFSFDLLEPNQNITQQVSMQLSDGLQPGPYFIIVETDYGNDLQESNEENNFASVAITVLGESNASNLIAQARKKQIEVFPNPTNDYLHVSLPHEEKRQYEIFSSDGLLIMKGTIRGNDKIYTEGLTKGLYWLRLDENEDNQMMRFVKL